MTRASKVQCPPFFRLDDGTGTWCINLTWNFGDAPLMPTRRQLAQLVDQVGVGLIIARPMTPGEVTVLVGNRATSDEEAFSFIITKDQNRWLPPRRHRR